MIGHPDLPGQAHEATGPARTAAGVYTRRQLDVLSFVKQYWEEEGAAPTLAEISQGMGGISRATVHQHVDQLVRKGAMRRVDGASTRNLEILDPAWKPHARLCARCRQEIGEEPAS